MHLLPSFVSRITITVEANDTPARCFLCLNHFPSPTVCQWDHNPRVIDMQVVSFFPSVFFFRMPRLFVRNNVKDFANVFIWACFSATEENKMNCDKNTFTNEDVGSHYGFYILWWPVKGYRFSLQCFQEWRYRSNMTATCGNMAMVHLLNICRSKHATTPHWMFNSKGDRHYKMGTIRKL